MGWAFPITSNIARNVVPQSDDPPFPSEKMALPLYVYSREGAGALTLAVLGRLAIRSLRSALLSPYGVRKGSRSSGSGVTQMGFSLGSTITRYVTLSKRGLDFLIYIMGVAPTS